MKQGHELSGIEVLRFACALGVLVWHYQHFFFLGAYDPALGAALRPTLPLYPAISVLYNNGLFAVNFFWVISGFIFYWHYSKSIRSGATRFPDFIIRRFSRLYPLHFITLLLVIVGQYIYHGSHHRAFIYYGNKPLWLVTQLFFASKWLTQEPESFNGPIWSVSVEILIYLLFFTVARTFRPSILVAGCVAAVSSLLYCFLSGPINPDVFSCGMYFFAGGVAQRLSVFPAAARVAGGVVAIVLLALTLGLYHLNDAVLLILATGVVIVAARLGQGTVLSGTLERLSFLGNATYSSYLIHFPLQLFLVIAADSLGWGRAIFLSPIAFLSFIGLVVGLSLVTYRYLEMPAQNYIRSATRNAIGRSSVTATH